MKPQDYKIAYKIVVKTPKGKKQIICESFCQYVNCIGFKPLNKKDGTELEHHGYRLYNGEITINSSNMDLLISKESIFI